MEYVTILIERDTSTRIPVTVPAYEVPVLEEIHGESRISEVSRSDSPDMVDAVEAHEALRRKYGDTVTAVVYRTPAVLGREFVDAKKADAKKAG